MPRRRDKVIEFRKPFRAVPLRKARNRPAPSGRSRGGWMASLKRMRPWLLLILLVVLILAGRALGWFNTFHDPQQITHRFPLCAATGYSPNCVVDGDTIRIGDRRIRLTGFDAPELDGACPQESLRAQEARAALHGWLSRGPFEMDGGTQPPRDQYGRELRAARRGEDYLVDHMVAGDHARRSGEARNWCR